MVSEVVWWRRIIFAELFHLDEVEVVHCRWTVKFNITSAPFQIVLKSLIFKQLGNFSFMKMKTVKQPLYHLKMIRFFNQYASPTANYKLIGLIHISFIAERGIMNLLLSFIIINDLIFKTYSRQRIRHNFTAPYLSTFDLYSLHIS